MFSALRLFWSPRPARGTVLRPLALAGALGAALCVSACGKSGADAASAAPPPPTVGVLTVRSGSVAVFADLPGRLQAVRSAQIRARATGVVQKRLFREGTLVKAGQALFQIDNAPYAAAMQSAQAQLARAQASQGQSSALARRYAPLMQAGAISKQEYDNALAAEKAANAEVLAAQAAVRTASLNLGYANVSAPISGRIGRAMVTEGAYVTQAEGTLLATIVQTDTLTVDLTQSASELMQLRRSLAAGKAGGAGDAAPVRIVLEDGSVYPLQGKLLFADATVDAATGQVSLRAEVPNPQGVLLPGLYVRVQVQQAVLPGAVLLPQQAVTRGGAQGDTVLTVGKDGALLPRVVQVGAAQGNQWVILSGLQDGEQVVVDGFMKLRPGVKTVQAVPWQAPAGAAAAAKPASAPASQAAR